MPQFRRGSTSAVLPPRGPSLVELVRARGLGAAPARDDVFADYDEEAQSTNEELTVAGKALWQQPAYLLDVPQVCIDALLASQYMSCSVQHHPLWSLRDLGLGDATMNLLDRSGVADLWPFQCNATPLILRGFNTLCAGPPKCGRSMAAMLAVITIYANSLKMREAPRVVFVVASDSQRKRCVEFLRSSLKDLDIEVSTTADADADIFVLLPFALAELSLTSVDFLWVSRIDRFAVPPLADHLPSLNKMIRTANVVSASCCRVNAEQAGALLPRRVVCSQDGDDFVWYNVTHTVDLAPNEVEKVQYMCEVLARNSSRLPCAVIVANKKAQEAAEEELKKWAPTLRIGRSLRDVARSDADIVVLSDWSATAIDCPRDLRWIINLSIPRRSALDVLTTRVAEVFGANVRKYVCHVWTIMSSPSWTDRHASEVKQLLLETHQQVPHFLRKVV